MLQPKREPTVAAEEALEALAWNGGPPDEYLPAPESEPDVRGPAAALAFVPVEDFAATEEQGAAAIVGTEDQALIPENGDVMVFGDGGSSKTTVTVDLAFHVAAGDDWLGLPVPHPALVLLIENEGPRPFFRHKLRRKLAAWRGSPIEGRVRVMEAPWGRFTFTDDRLVNALADGVRKHEADVLIVGPLTGVGMDEAGTLQQVRDFAALINRVRELSGRRLAVIIVHHENRAGTVSGAWEPAGDTLLHLRKAGHGKTIAHVQKARWANELHARTLTLLWAPGETYVVEEPEERDVSAEMERLMSDGLPRTLPELAKPTDAGGIGRSQADIRDVLKDNPRYRVLTRDELRQARPDAAHNTKLYVLIRPPDKPDKQARPPAPVCLSGGRMSPLVMFDRNGPPGAMHCPAVVCDFCGEPIQGPDAEESGHVIWWQRYDVPKPPGGGGRAPFRSPLFFTHMQCDRREHLPTYTFENGWGYSLWDTLGAFFDQLRHNVTHPFTDDHGAEYVAPRK